MKILYYFELTLIYGNASAVSKESGFRGTILTEKSSFFVLLVDFVKMVIYYVVRRVLFILKRHCIVVFTILGTLFV